MSFGHILLICMHQRSRIYENDEGEAENDEGVMKVVMKVKPFIYAM